MHKLIRAEQMLLLLLYFRTGKARYEMEPSQTNLQPLSLKSLDTQCCSLCCSPWRPCQRLRPTHHCICDAGRPDGAAYPLVWRQKPQLLLLCIDKQQQHLPENGSSAAYVAALTCK